MALICLMVPMFASYFFDDMFSTLSQLFQHPECLELGWNSADYGFYAGGYSFLCVFGGLVICGVLLDVFGVKIVGSIFVALMAIGAGTVLTALRSGLPPQTSLGIAYIGCMLFRQSFWKRRFSECRRRASCQSSRCRQRSRYCHHGVSAWDDDEVCFSCSGQILLNCSYTEITVWT